MSFEPPPNRSRKGNQNELSFASSGSEVSDKLPPQNLDAERGVLGAILLDNEQFDEVAELISSPDDFYRLSHRSIYEQMIWMRANGIVIDAITLADRLEQIGIYKKIGGDDLLEEVANSVPHSANARYHADIVAQKAVTRKIIEASTDNIRDGYSNLYTSQQMLESAEKRIFAIRDKEVTKGTVGIMTAVEEVIAAMDRAKGGGEVDWLLTGISQLDKILLGMQGGQLIVLAGRPGAGKSTLAAQIARHVSSNPGQNASSLFVSLEMKTVEIGRRLVSAAARINSKILKNSDVLTTDQEKRIVDAAGKVAMTRIHIDDTPAQSLMRIAANARRWKRKDNLGLLVVDYLQKIKEQSIKGENRTTTVGRISTGLKDLAKELDIPILALAQLNRESEKDERPPRMSDLRESGDIEADADVILLLHNLTPKGIDVGPVDLIVAKNRDGEEGVVKLVFDRPHNTFSPVAFSGQIREREIQEDAFDNPREAPFNDFQD